MKSLNVVMIVKKAIESGYDQNDIQVLAPIYKGVAGIDALNLALQEVFNPKEDQDEYRIGQTVYRVGDKFYKQKIDLMTMFIMGILVYL